jgi:hypothetical protein
MMTFLRENSLTLVMMLFFGVAPLGQILTGWDDFNDDQREHGASPASLVEYLGSGRFGVAVFENWESEFLQMGVLILLTARLRQKGSPESKSRDRTEDVDRERLRAPQSIRQWSPSRRRQLPAGSPWQRFRGASR